MNIPTAIQNQINCEIDPAFAKRAEFIFGGIARVKPVKILDAGCGRGFYTSNLTHFPFIEKISAIDVKSEYIEKARQVTSDKRVELQVASLYKLPFKKNTFDAVILSEILEHVDDERALLEVWRVLKPGGMVLISVPSKHYPFLWDPLNWILEHFLNTHVNKNIWWLAGIWADHERLYSSDELKHVIEKSGFQAEEIRGVVHHSWPFSHFLLYSIGKNLVERAGMDGFNRFSSDPKPAAKMLAKLVAWPSTFDSKADVEKSCVDLMVRANKLK